MKIGIFTDTYNPTVSGVVTSVNMIEQELKKRGHEVYVFAPSKSIQPNDNQTLYMLKSMPLLVAKQYKNRVATFYSRDVAKKIKEIGIDIVHTQSEFGLGHFGKVMSRKMGIPFIHTYHTMWEDYIHYIIPIHGRNIYSKRFVRTFSRSFVRKAECVITPSKKTEKYLKYKCKVKNKPIYVIPTGIDTTAFLPSNFTDEQRISLKSSLGILPNEKVVLFLGRVAEEKSVDLILKNMPQLFKTNPNTKFLIVGDGPSKNDLEKLAKDLNISDKVIFTGKVAWKEVPKYYSIADIFVNASITETQGLTFLEAMASGVPIVAKYAPNLTEYIHHQKNGILLRNPQDFAKCIKNVLDNKELHNKFSKAGLETAQNYSVEEFGDKLEALYTEVIRSYKIKKSLITKKERNNEKKNLYKTVTSKLVELTHIKKRK